VGYVAVDATSFDSAPQAVISAWDSSRACPAVPLLPPPLLLLLLLVPLSRLRVNGASLPMLNPSAATFSSSYTANWMAPWETCCAGQGVCGWLTDWTQLVVGVHRGALGVLELDWQRIAQEPRRLLLLLSRVACIPWHSRWQGWGGCLNQQQLTSSREGSRPL
jgi:hypothetical protein